MGKSKAILGIKKSSEFTLEERKKIIEDWLESGWSKRDIWYKYTGDRVEKGRIIYWMRQLGIENPRKQIRFKEGNSSFMANPDKKSPELLQMEAKIKELEKALVNSELRAIALDTMIEIAEKELKINIRKKSNTKQSTK